MSRSWSSAHDWKSCRGQKLLESSNLSISATRRNGFHSVPTFFFCKAKKNVIHSVASVPPLKIEPAALGFNFVFGVSKSALLRRLFMPAAKKTSSARSLAPPFKTEAKGFGFGLDRNRGFRRFFFAKQKRTSSTPLHPFLRSKLNPLRWASILFLGFSKPALRR